MAGQMLVEAGRRRRSYSVEEKQRIVAETMKPGASVSRIARRHDVNANLVFTWRHKHRRSVPALLPVTITPTPAPVKSAVPQSRARAARKARIEIVLAGGHRILIRDAENVLLIRHIVEALAR